MGQSHALLWSQSPCMGPLTSTSFSAFFTLVRYAKSQPLLVLEPSALLCLFLLGIICLEAPATIILRHQISNFGRPPNYLEGMITYTLLGVTPECLIQQVWGRPGEFALLTNSLMMLMLLVQDCILRATAVPAQVPVQSPASSDTLPCAPSASLAFFLTLNTSCLFQFQGLYTDCSL